MASGLALWRDMEGAAAVLGEYLEAALPLVAEAMAESGAPLEALPDVVVTGPPEPRLEHYPAVNVVPMEVVELSVIDVDAPAGPAPAVPSVATPQPVTGLRCWVTYALRVYFRVRGQDYADTERERDRLARALRLAVLADLGLGITDNTVAVDPSSLVGSFSDLGRQADRSIAAGWMAVRARLEETLPYSTLGIAGTITSTMTPLPHPALG